MAYLLPDANPLSEPILELLIAPLETNVIAILIEIHSFSFRKIYMKLSYKNGGHFCLGLNVLTDEICVF